MYDEQDPDDTFSITTETNGNKYLQFNSYGPTKILYTKNLFETKNFDEQFFFMADIKSDMVSPYLRMGGSETYKLVPDPQFGSSHSTHTSYPYYMAFSTTVNEWNHHENLNKFSKPVYLSFFNVESTGTQCIDNLYLFSSHGPLQINQSAYRHTNPVVQILSIDHEDQSSNIV